MTNTMLVALFVTIYIHIDRVLAAGQVTGQHDVLDWYQ